MATDLAEVVGGAIALYLLFDLPLLVGGVITGVVSLAAARDPEPARPTDVRAGDHRAAAGHRDRIPDQPVRRATAARPTWPRAWCRGSTAPRASCWPPRCSARRSCRTRSTCTPAWPATGTATPRPVRPRRRLLRVTRLRRRAGDARRRRGEPRDAAGRRDQPAGPRQHRLHRGRVRRRARHARPDGRTALRDRPAGLRSGVDVGRAPTPAR